ITGECLYQKTAPPGLPTWITTRRIRSEHAALGYSDYVLVTERAALAYFVNLGYISVHPWSCTVDALDRPDLMLFDLDPTEIAFREVRNAALLVRDLLNGFRIRAWVKTSGGRGLHVLVPLTPQYSFAQVRSAAEVITRLARSREPSLFTLDMRRARRRGKILIDVHRNHRGATLVSPWAVRESDHRARAAPHPSCAALRARPSAAGHRGHHRHGLRGGQDPRWPRGLMRRLVAAAVALALTAVAVPAPATAFLVEVTTSVSI